MVFIAIAINTYAQVPTANLVCHYPFTGNANDQSGNGNHGTVSGATLTIDRFGLSTGAYQFNGQSDFIDLSNHASSFNQLTGSVSISFWVKTPIDTPQAIFGIAKVPTTSTTNGTNIFIGENVTGYNTDELITTGNRSSLSIYNISSHENPNDRCFLFDNDWHHFVIVYNTNSTIIYLDNSQLPSLITNYGNDHGQFPNIPSTSIVSLGSRYFNGQGVFLKGALDDFRIYNSALNLTEVASLYYEIGKNGAGRSNSSAQTIIIETGSSIMSSTSHFKSNEIKVYPNPAKDHLFIDSRENSVGGSITIVNSIGQSVFETEINSVQYEIDLSTWTGKGIYFLQIYDDNHILKETTKIILQ